jgi:hypothetical protein
MKYILSGWAGLMLLCLSTQAQAQSALPYVVAAGGGSAPIVSVGYTVDFTVGESIIASVGTNPQLTQGFQQPSTSATPLPVDMLDFTGTAREGYNLLNWRTAQEKNNSHFEIQRSTDGIRFTTIGTVFSKARNGNSSGELAYTYNDRSITEPVNYYRLKQVDLDKHYAYTGVIKLVNYASQSSITVFPNPVTDKVRVSIKGNFDGLTLQVVDVTGRAVLKAIKVTAADTDLDLSVLSQGAYYIKCIRNNQSDVIKIVKQ